MLKIKEFFEKQSCTFTYLVYDESTKDTIIIDPVLNYDPEKKVLSEESYSELKNFIYANNLTAHYSLETHIHADHITAAQRLKRDYPTIKTAINKNVCLVQKTFASKLKLPKNFKEDGSQFDVLFSDDDILEAGSISAKAIFTPGHTPTCTSFLIEDKLFTGDAIFMPDFGTGRCDFPNGNASLLYDSIVNRIYTLDDTTKIYVGHDYRPGGRKLKFQTSVLAQKESNIHLSINTKKEDFVSFRESRDSGLSAPRLLRESLEANITAGK